MSAWSIRTTEQFEHDLKKMLKRHPDDTKRALANLGTYQKALELCDNPLQVIRLMTCVHRESCGCVAITEQPAPKNSVPVRLYLYAHVVERTIHLICAGDKQTQKVDNDCCQKYVKKNIKAS